MIQTAFWSPPEWPAIITENGVATPNDDWRIVYLIFIRQSYIYSILPQRYFVNTSVGVFCICLEYFYTSSLSAQKNTKTPCKHDSYKGLIDYFNAIVKGIFCVVSDLDNI